MTKTDERIKKRTLEKLVGGELASVILHHEKEMTAQSTKNLKPVEVPFFIRLAEEQKEVGDGSFMQRWGELQSPTKPSNVKQDESYNGTPISQLIEDRPEVAEGDLLTRDVFTATMNSLREIVDNIILQLNEFQSRISTEMAKRESERKDFGIHDLFLSRN